MRKSILAGLGVVGIYGALASSASAEVLCGFLAGAQCYAVEALPNTGDYVLVNSQGDKGKKSSGTSELEVEGVAKVTCTAAAESGTINSSETSTVFTGTTIEFTKCSVVGEASCKVTEPIKTKSLVGEMLVTSEKISGVLFKPTTGTEFAEVKIKECLKAASIPVTGVQSCKAEHIEEGVVEHIVGCEKGGSELKDGAKKVSFQLNEGITTGEAVDNFVVVPNHY